MFKDRLCIISALIILTSTLHLRGGNFHMALSSSQLSSTLQNSLAKLTALKNSIELSQSSLNPYSQTDRISTLENTIVSARKQLIQINSDCALPLSNQQYYCQAIPATLSNSIKASLDNINDNAAQLG